MFYPPARSANESLMSVTPIVHKQKNGSSSIEHVTRVLFPPANSIATKFSEGLPYTYDLYSGEATDPECPINWNDVTFVYINNFKWSESSNQEIAIFLKKNLPIGAKILTLRSLPYWESKMTSAVRMTRKKSHTECAFKSFHSEETDRNNRLNIAMPVQKFRSPECSFQWNPDPLDFFVHQVQI